MDAALPDHIQGLLSPKAYPHAPKNVELRQTHISYIFLADELVYKTKKPLDLGFLDFTTLEKRRHFCEEEVRLNQRLCDETYLGVVPVVNSEAGVQVEAEGEPIDFAVKMRRLPEDGMMTVVLERNALTPAQLRQLAAKIAEFHASSEQSDKIDELGGFETAKTNWQENFDQTVSKIGVTISQEQFDDIRGYIRQPYANDGVVCGHHRRRHHERRQGKRAEKLFCRPHADRTFQRNRLLWLGLRGADIHKWNNPRFGRSLRSVCDIQT